MARGEGAEQYTHSSLLKKKGEATEDTEVSQVILLTVPTTYD